MPPGPKPALPRPVRSAVSVECPLPLARPGGVASEPRRERPASALDLALLVLRAAALFLLVTYGRQKFGNYFSLLRTGAPLSSSGLTPLIRAVGFPAPAFLGVFAVLCESVGAGLVAAGLATRPAAACLVLSMTGAFYTSMRLGEEPLRALLYAAIFLALAFVGAGAFSLDAVISSRRKARE